MKKIEKGNLEPEAFLFQVDRKLLGEAFDSKIEKVVEKGNQIRKMKQELNVENICTHTDTSQLKWSCGARTCPWYFPWIMGAFWKCTSRLAFTGSW